MGRFKDEMNVSPLIPLLLSQGFKEMTGAQGEEGYTKIYSTSNGLYSVWVTVNVRTGKVNVYKEYECGGCVGEDEYQLSKVSLKNEEVFVDELDEFLENWIGGY